MRKLSFLLSILILYPGCSYVQKRLDRAGLNEKSEEIVKNFKPGNPKNLKKFIDNASIDELTRPEFTASIKNEPLNKWNIRIPGKIDIIKEKISFPSSLKHSDKNDRAVFYIYRAGKLKGKKVILWVPGMGVSDIAFLLIRKFFVEGLKRDYAIVFYVPPFHLERIESGKESGVGFFTSNTMKNVRVLLNTVKELRTITEYLKSNGVTQIAGWGGSMGASTLLLTSMFVKMDHMTVMIPVVDWKTIALNNMEMKRVRESYRRSGFDNNLLGKAYDLISPSNYDLNLKSSRILVLYAKYDQITPPIVLKEFADRYNLTNVIGYNRSHATILINSKMYRDYGTFLDKIRN